ncbi:hypothetical protein ACIBRY_24470 [Streptomyces anulatus]
MDKDESGLTDAVAEALGGRRTAAPAELARRAAELRDMSEDAGTNDVLLVPLTGPARRKWERLARREAEDWVFGLTDEPWWTSTVPSSRPGASGRPPPRAP